MDSPVSRGWAGPCRAAQPPRSVARGREILSAGSPLSGFSSSPVWKVPERRGTKGSPSAVATPSSSSSSSSSFLCISHRGCPENVGLGRQPRVFADQVQDKLQILTVKALWPVMKALKENCKYRSYWQNSDLALGWSSLSHSGRFDPGYWHGLVFQYILNSWKTRSF